MRIFYSIHISIIVIVLLLGGCESAEKYQRDESAEEAPQPIGGEVALSGSPEEIAWARDLTEALEAARLRYDLADTAGAIVAVDSLIRVAETALDTLPIDHDLNRFLVVYVADAYGGVQEWYQAMGEHDAVLALSRRYRALAARLQERRDSAAAAIR